MQNQQNDDFPKTCRFTQGIATPIILPLQTFPFMYLKIAFSKSCSENGLIFAWGTSGKRLVNYTTAGLCGAAVLAVVLAAVLVVGSLV